VAKPGAREPEDRAQPLNAEQLLGKWMLDDYTIQFLRNGEFRAFLEGADPWRANAWKGEWALKNNGKKLFIAQTHWAGALADLLAVLAEVDHWNELNDVWLEEEIKEELDDRIVFKDGTELLREDA
jgi:hypothetical protein